MERPPARDELLRSQPPLPRRPQGFLCPGSAPQTACDTHAIQGARLRPNLRPCLDSNLFSPSQAVKLDGYEAVESFLYRFPPRCRVCIRSLYVSMRPEQLGHPPPSQTDLLVALLSTCTMVQSLTLYVYGSTQKHIIPPFARLINLTSLFIGNVADEQQMPL